MQLTITITVSIYFAILFCFLPFCFLLFLCVVARFWCPFTSCQFVCEEPRPEPLICLVVKSFEAIFSAKQFNKKCR